MHPLVQCSAVFQGTYKWYISLQFKHLPKDRVEVGRDVGIFITDRLALASLPNLHLDVRVRLAGGGGSRLVHDMQLQLTLSWCEYTKTLYFCECACQPCHRGLAPSSPQPIEDRNTHNQYSMQCNNYLTHIKAHNCVYALTTCIYYTPMQHAHLL